VLTRLSYSNGIVRIKRMNFSTELKPFDFLTWKGNAWCWLASKEIIFWARHGLAEDMTEVMAEADWADMGLKSDDGRGEDEHRPTPGG
jgi:hypothetical protein